MSTAVLLIAHGSRRAEANQDLEYVAEALRARGEYPIVEVCYLELAQPDIATGAARCVEKGASRLLLLPYFLSAGVHVSEDLEEAGRSLVERFGIPVVVAEPLGRHPLLVEIVCQRARAAEHRFTP
jgi:sirohydrochlorin ferrochelatase